jgi:hypothetical protein
MVEAFHRHSPKRASCLSSPLSNVAGLNWTSHITGSSYHFDYSQPGGVLFSVAADLFDFSQCFEFICPRFRRNKDGTCTPLRGQQLRSICGVESPLWFAFPNGWHLTNPLFSPLEASSPCCRCNFAVPCMNSVQLSHTGALPHGDLEYPLPGFLQMIVCSCFGRVPSPSSRGDDG